MRSSHLNENVKTKTIFFFDFHISTSLRETCCLCMHRRGARFWDGNLSVYDILRMYWRWLLFKAQFDSCGSFHEKDINKINKDYALSSYQLMLVLKYIYLPIDGRDSRLAISKKYTIAYISDAWKKFAAFQRTDDV